MAARLRACISDEKRNPGAYAIYSIGVPGDEFEYCTRGTDRLRSLLKQVSLDPVTHDRFMTVFLHLEARLNRIPKMTNTLDLSQVIFNRNEEYSDIFNEFVQQVRGLRNPQRLANIDPAVNNRSERQSPIRGDIATDGPRVNTAGRSPNVSISQVGSRIDSRTPPSHIPVNAATNFQMPPNNNHLTESNVSVPRASSPNGNGHPNIGGTGPQILNQSIPNLSDPERSVQLLRQWLGNVNWLPNVSNATMNSGDGARLSQQFQPVNRPLLTPIPSQIIQPIPLYTTANNQGGITYHRPMLVKC